MSVPGSVDSNFLHRRAALTAISMMPGPVQPEHHPALELGGRVVEVDDGPRGTGQ